MFIVRGRRHNCASKIAEFDITVDHWKVRYEWFTVGLIRTSRSLNFVIEYCLMSNNRNAYYNVWLNYIKLKLNNWAITQCNNRRPNGQLFSSTLYTRNKPPIGSSPCRHASVDETTAGGNKTNKNSPRHTILHSNFPYTHTRKFSIQHVSRPRGNFPARFIIPAAPLVGQHFRLSSAARGISSPFSSSRLRPPLFSRSARRQTNSPFVFLSSLANFYIYVRSVGNWPRELSSSSSTPRFSGELTRPGTEGNFGATDKVLFLSLSFLPAFCSTEQFYGVYRRANFRAYTLMLCRDNPAPAFFPRARAMAMVVQDKLGNRNPGNARELNLGIYWTISYICIRCEKSFSGFGFWIYERRMCGRWTGGIYSSFIIVEEMLEYRVRSYFFFFLS